MAEGICRYYFFTACLFLFLAIFTGTYKSTFKDDVCVKLSSNTTTSQQLTTADILTVKLTNIPGVMMGFYATEFGLTFVVVVLLLYFKRLLPRDFAHMGRILKCFGLWLKIFPKLIILMHYIILILLVVFIALVGSNQCRYSYRKSDIGMPSATPTDMQKQGVVLAIITVFLWVVMHIGGCIVRSMLYTDPFLTEPEDPKGNQILRIIFIRCGP